MKKLRIPFIISVVVILLLSTAYVAFARGNAHHGVLPPASHIQGLTYGEWLAKWWQYTLTIPASENPLTGGSGANCVFQRVGNVALVVANSTLGTPIHCEVPAGTMLYVEVLGAECSTLEPPPFYGGNEAELRACAQEFVPQDIQATIDGKVVRNLSKYIVISPLYEFTVPEDNIFGVPAGTTGQSVGYGAYLMLAPLSPGKHTLHLSGTYPAFEFTADKTFDLIVIPKP
jgi:hypothetical protein